MGYFKDSQDESVEELFNRLGDICLEELMLSSDAYVCMIELNLQGYKRLHRHLSKEFYTLYLDLQKESFEHTNKTVSIDGNFKKYKPRSIKEHLEDWTEILEGHLKEVGYIIKSIFEAKGFIPCVAQELQRIFYRNIIKNERTMKMFEDCDYNPEIIYKKDFKLHKRMRKIEEEHGYKDIHDRH
jgi:hypothetical protein